MVASTVNSIIEVIHKYDGIPMSLKKILLIDDDHTLVSLLSEYLSGEGFEVIACYDGESGIEEAYKQNIDLILLDVMMPKMDGFSVLKALGEHYKTPILMLTAKGDDNDRILGLELGADDYLPKPFKHRELLARINAILRRINIAKQQEAPKEKNTVNHITINYTNRQVTCHNNIVELTGTEFQILAYLIEHSGSIVKKEDISEKVLERKLTPFDRSIDMHVSNIRKKLCKFSTDDKMKTIRGAGYILLTGE